MVERHVRDRSRCMNFNLGMVKAVERLSMASTASIGLVFAWLTGEADEVEVWLGLELWRSMSFFYNYCKAIVLGITQCV